MLIVIHFGDLMVLLDLTVKLVKYKNNFSLDNVTSSKSYNFCKFSCRTICQAQGKVLELDI